MPNPVTSIKDIARLAGVSHSTVSRALAGNPRIPEATRSRILSLASELGYTPSLIARSLVKQETRTLGVVVASLTDPYAVEVVGGIACWRVRTANRVAKWLRSRPWPASASMV